MTGAGGFVGSNVVRVLGERHGVEVAGPSRAEVDITDADAVARAVAAFAPDAIVHCAILNDPVALERDRRAALEPTKPLAPVSQIFMRTPSPSPARRARRTDRGPSDRSR